MYRLSSQTRTLVLCGGLLFSFLCATAIAGPEEDYKRGARSFNDGDVVSAMGPLKRAADAGHAAAQWMYGYILDNADQDVEAVEYYRKSAEQGYAQGQHSLGGALIAGEGVKPDAEEGRKWIRRAAEGGLEPAIEQMALYALESGGGKMDNADALRWIREAADKNFVPAMEGLVQAYRNGNYGLQLDAKLANEWAAKIRKLQGLDKRGKRKGSKVL